MHHKHVKRLRKSMPQWHVFLMRTSEESTIKLGVWMHLKTKNRTQVEVAGAAVDSMANDSNMDTNSCHQKIFSTSCSSVKNRREVEVMEVVFRESTSTNKLADGRKPTQMKVNCS